MGKHYTYADVSNLAHMMTHSAPAEGLQAGPVYIAISVAQMIGSYAQHFDSDRVYFCLDSEYGSWRKQVCPEYKAQRDKMFEDKPQEEAKRQMAIEACKLMPELIKLLEVPVFTMPFVEADDILAAAVDLNADVDGIIISSDKDLWQLVTPRVSQTNPAHGYKVFLGPEGTLIKEKSNGTRSDIGLTPNQFVVAKAMIGDNSDNLPGLIGCGEKTAAKHISAGTVEQYLTESTGFVKKRRTKTTPSMKVHQDARSVVSKNLKLMSLKRSQIFQKVKIAVGQMQKEGVRPPRNSATRLTMWLEHHGYNNPEVVQVLVSRFTEQWVR